MPIFQGTEVLQWGFLGSSYSPTLPSRPPVAPHGLAVPSIQVPAIMEKFRGYLEIDRQLQPRTVKDHTQNITKFLAWTGGNAITKDTIRSYLSSFKDKSACTRRNKLISLFVFSAFLGREELTEGFKFPQIAATPKFLPSREKLKEFYQALPSQKSRVAFLTFASSGMRRGEFLSLRRSMLDLDRGIIDLSKVHSGATKHSWVGILNSETLVALKEYLSTAPGDKIYPNSREDLNREFQEAQRKTGIKVRPQVLRAWHSSELGTLGMADRYVDALEGRIPKSVLARHYSEFSPEKLLEVYNKAGLRILV